MVEGTVNALRAHSPAAGNCGALAGGPMKEILWVVIKIEIN